MLLLNYLYIYLGSFITYKMLIIAFTELRENGALNMSHLFVLGWPRSAPCLGDV